LRRSRVALAAAAVLLTGTSGYAVLDAYDRVPGILTISAPAPTRAVAHYPGSSATQGAGATSPAPAVPATAPSAAAPLLALDAAAPKPSRAALAARMANVLRDARLGGSLGMVVRDTATRAELFDRSGNAPRPPASTVKLLTAAASLQSLGPGATATTSVVLGRTPGTVVLVAGGDSLLGIGKGNPATVAGRAGLGDLAAQVATSLLSTGVRSVRVGLDDHVAAGPRYAPTWLQADINAGFTGPVAMLGLASRRPARGRPAPPDPAMVATQAFVTALRSHGVRVAGAPRRARAPAGAARLGAVSSAPVVDVLSVALFASDNAVTETVARRAAVRAGAGTSFASVAAFVKRTVGRMGIDTSGVRLVDSCGLSRGTGVPARVLSDVLELAVDGRHAALQQVVARLPVAGLNGTLRSRFRLSSTKGAAGVARAKTGTLTGVSALAGTVVDRDGRLLTFAIMADRVPTARGSPGARAAIDRVVATLAGCGCR